MRDQHRHTIAVLLLILYLPLLLAMEFSHKHAVPGTVGGDHLTVAHQTENAGAISTSGADCLACIFANSLSLEFSSPDIVIRCVAKLIHTVRAAAICSVSLPSSGRSPPAFLLL